MKNNLKKFNSNTAKIKSLIEGLKTDLKNILNSDLSLEEKYLAHIQFYKLYGTDYYTSYDNLPQNIKKTLTENKENFHSFSTITPDDIIDILEESEVNNFIKDIIDNKIYYIYLDSYLFNN